MSEKEDRSQPLQTIVDIIVEETNPEQVILFGSRAKGTAQEESDYDFLVVVRVAQNEREISRRVYRTLLEAKVGVAVDIVVTSAGTLERHRENPFFVYRQALQEGRVLYDHGGV
jgi:predicted nucleotidyltransferase